MRIFRYVFILVGDELNSTLLASKLSGDYTICDPETIGNIADFQGLMSVAPLVEAVVDDDYE